MLKASLRRIKSAPKRFAVGLLLALAGLAVIVVAVLGIIGTVTWDGPVNDVLLINGHSYTLETATTQAAQEKGLGGRDAMPADRGMLFEFSKEAQRCFWMKDMRFPLDIIWMNSDKEITAIEPDLAPDTYPRTYCQGGRYVLELHAGAAKANHLVIDQKLTF